MKKILSLILACALLLGCAAFAEENSAVLMGNYILKNCTGENIKSIKVTDNNNAEHFMLAEYPEGLADGASAAISFSIPADESGEHRLSLTFVTESGFEATQPTLSIENAVISLNKVDAASGATPFTFAMMQQLGEYTIVNQTGEAVTEVKIADNQNPDEWVMAGFGEAGLADGASFAMSFGIPKDEDGSHRLTLSFKLASGEEKKFETLSIENVTINLLSTDAMTGATPISFAMAPKAE